MSADLEGADRPERNREPGRGPGRFLAPLALIAVVVAVIVIVASAGGSSRSSPAPITVETSTTSGGSRPATSTRGATSTKGGTSRTTVTTSTTGTSTAGTSTVGTYTIQSGDTFGVISSKTGVSVATIEKLNPGVSSTSLTVGQVIKLK